MNVFENKLIVKEDIYKGGFFPIVPQYEKQGSAFILTGGVRDDIVINEHTSSKMIRQGKYTRLVEISTSSYLKEIRFSSPSKESAYLFDVYVKAVIQVNNPILFYQNRNIDVDAYFNNLFSLDVRKVTKKYSILDYDGMDDELQQTLSSYNTIDKATGFSYQISVVDATPGENAKDFVERYSRQQVEAGLRLKTQELVGVYSDDYTDAIKIKIAEGTMDEAEGLLRIEEYRNSKFEKKIKIIEEMRNQGIITDKVARESGTSELKYMSVGIMEDTAKIDVNKKGWRKYYSEDEE